MKMVKIKNWARWQTYRSDRGLPPWIKLHRCLLRNPDWIALTDAEKGQLVSMWILAAEHHGSIPNDEETVMRLCCLQNRPIFKTFADNGFLDFGVNMTSTWRQLDVNLTHSEGRRKNEEEEKNPPNPPSPPGGGAARPRRDRNSEIAARASEVVKILNEITGRSFSETRGNDAIEAALRRGASVEECREVLSFLWSKWYHNHDMARFVNKVTPFRKSHFDAYLDESRAGVATGAAPEQKLPESAIAMLERVKAKAAAKQEG